jgi:hypothetical protein
VWAHLIATRFIVADADHDDRRAVKITATAER